MVLLAELNNLKGKLKLSKILEAATGVGVGGGGGSKQASSQDKHW